jgi:outer membrane cobalamin receptor
MLRGRVTPSVISNVGYPFDCVDYQAAGVGIVPAAVEMPSGITETATTSISLESPGCVKGEDTVLTGRPEWTAGAVMQWQLSERWQTALDYQYTGEQWATSRHTGMEVTEELADFHCLDWVLQWRATSAWQMQLSVDNLLEENYETAVGFPAPEREFRLSVRFSH